MAFTHVCVSVCAVYRLQNSVYHNDKQNSKRQSVGVRQCGSVNKFYRKSLLVSVPDAETFVKNQYTCLELAWADIWIKGSVKI